MRRIPLSALIGLMLTAGFFFVAIFAQWIAPYRMDELIGGVWDPISAKHWLGTDSIGRDLLSRMDERFLSTKEEMKSLALKMDRIVELLTHK